MKYSILSLLIFLQILGYTQDLKFGIGAGIGVNSQRTSSLILEGDVSGFTGFTPGQIPESFLFSAYIERSLKKKWSFILGVEQRSLNITSFRNFWQTNIHFMFSKYFRISKFPNKLKVSIGPELSVYLRNFRNSSGAPFETERFLSEVENLSHFNFSSKLMLLYNSLITERGSLNLGVLLNIGVYNPIRNTISYYQSDTGFDTPFWRKPAEKYLSHRITRILHPVHFMFLIQYELQMRKK